MPTIGSETKAARIRKEDIDKIKPILEEMTFSEWVHRQINSSNVGVPKDIVSDFNAILSMYDTDFTEFFKALYRKVESCEIDVDEIIK